MNINQIMGLQQANMNQQQGGQNYDPTNPFDPNNTAQLMAQVRKIQQQSLPPEPTGFLPFLMDFAGDIGTAHLRASRNPTANQLGQIYKTSADRAAERQKMIPDAEKVLNYLQGAYNQNKTHQYHTDTLEENKRNNQAREKHATSKLEELTRHNKAHETAELPLQAFKTRQLKRELEDENKVEKFRTQYNIPEATSIRGMPADAKKDLLLEMRDRVNAPAKMAPVINIFEKMEKIVSENPDLGVGVAAALYGDQSSKGALETLKRKYTMSKDKKKLDAIHQMEKFSNTLVLKQLQGLKGQRASVFLEKIMSGSNPSYIHSAETLKVLADEARDTLAHARKDSEISKKAFKDGIYIPETEPQYGNMNVATNAGPGYTEEDLEYTAKKHNLSREEVIDLYKQGG